jgi:hypothetical protein
LPIPETKEKIFLFDFLWGFTMPRLFNFDALLCCFYYSTRNGLRQLEYRQKLEEMREGGGAAGEWRSRAVHTPPLVFPLLLRLSTFAAEVSSFAAGVFFLSKKC